MLLTLTDPIELDTSPQAWDAWDPWAIASLLDGLQARWWVVGGWALDLFRGQQSREHEDLEIATPMWDFDVVRGRLSDYEFFVAGREGFWPVDGAGEAFFDYHQTLVRDPSSGKWRVDVMRDPDDRAHWICRMDRTVRRPYGAAVSTTADGIPYLRPELVLLFKSLQTRPQDQLDFAATVPLMSPAARRWLAQTIRRARGDSHPWLAVLT